MSARSARHAANGRRAEFASFWNPSRHVVHRGFQFSARLAFWLEEPRASVIRTTPASPMANLAIQVGM